MKAEAGLPFVFTLSAFAPFAAEAVEVFIFPRCLKTPSWFEVNIGLFA